MYEIVLPETARRFSLVWDGVVYYRESLFESSMERAERFYAPVAAALGIPLQIHSYVSADKQAVAQLRAMRRGDLRGQVLATRYKALEQALRNS